MLQTVSPALARRIALGAQGFGRRSGVTPGIRQLDALVNRLELLQIDSVNVFERSHYLPAFSRLGRYDKAQLDRLTSGREARFTEYWAHEASFLPLDTRPLFGWRMQQYRDLSARSPDAWSAGNKPLLDWLLAELAEKGPLPASAIEHDANRRSGPWWGWSDVKTGLEVLFRWGDVVSAGRSRFERVYGLPEQIFPAELLGRRVEPADAHRELVRRAARAHGIGTANDFADYFRLKSAPTLAAIRDLTDAGELLPVEVPGWGPAGSPGAAWLHRDARLPRSVDADAVLSPFDPVVWNRGRAQRLFGFHYRIEIYTPQPKRVFGYYVLPVLLGDTIVGRVDLKNDRQAGVLRVQAAWSEPGAPRDTAERLAGVLRETAAWQGLGAIDVRPRGTLAAALAAEL
ncbi:winged helix-turn-helix domain-containing protein [Cryobacterium sp. TMT1-21]|uniref:Winged helix-turn-helix domain-containing protein n=2 Tax=Cryobacterium TaxID=69578 RepID=A0AAQ2HGB9_9MICO|nr:MULTISPECIES: crosslink repair DNA glycosylase YcaQ family protein [Cryobacterium]TFC51192.1 winged helix-turn-helix domain-containing protein [Cryobacterium shii]TFD11367.1 winged helix-turn-helix domain-containing protein [Cryobacterium sp. TMT1-21]TFD18815.1 winged helix-turn-helix domain-containing protein [Cryobacterium sp. TMT2-23]TFD38680.1 winged helix-turn-helix domain-containing protein [Cryobacterium sp. TMT2-10]